MSSRVTLMFAAGLVLVLLSPTRAQGPPGARWTRRSRWTRWTWRTISDHGRPDPEGAGAHRETEEPAQEARHDDVAEAPADVHEDEEPPGRH